MPRRSILSRARGASGRLYHARLIDERRLYALWEVQQLRRLFRYCEVDCVFDIGANLGQYAEMLRHRVGFGGLIVWFGPTPAAAEAPRAKARGSALGVVEELAIGKDDGEQSFHIMKAPQFSSLSTPRQDEVDLLRGLNEVDEVVTVKTENLATAF